MEMLKQSAEEGVSLSSRCIFGSQGNTIIFPDEAYAMALRQPKSKIAWGNFFPNTSGSPNADDFIIWIQVEAEYADAVKRLYHSEIWRKGVSHVLAVVTFALDQCLLGVSYCTRSRKEESSSAWSGWSFGQAGSLHSKVLLCLLELFRGASVCCHDRTPTEAAGGTYRAV